MPAMRYCRTPNPSLKFPNFCSSPDFNISLVFIARGKWKPPWKANAGHPHQLMHVLGLVLPTDWPHRGLLMAPFLTQKQALCWYNWNYLMGNSLLNQFDGFPTQFWTGNPYDAICVKKNTQVLVDPTTGYNWLIPRVSGDIPTVTSLVRTRSISVLSPPCLMRFPTSTLRMRP